MLGSTAFAKGGVGILLAIGSVTGDVPVIFFFVGIFMVKGLIYLRNCALETILM